MYSSGWGSSGDQEWWELKRGDWWCPAQSPIASFLRLGGSPAPTLTFESVQQVHKLDQLPRTEEFRRNPSPRVSTQSAGQCVVVEQVLHHLTKGIGIAWVFQQNTVNTVDDLILDASNGTRDDRTCLQHALSDGESETFVEALLNDDRSMTLDRIHHCRVLLDIVHLRDRQTPS